jgi:hypothetical protein
MDVHKAAMYMDETDPMYYSTYTYAQHMYCQNARLYAFDSLIKRLCVAEGGTVMLRFLTSFVVDEMDFVVHHGDIVSQPHPMVIVINSRLCVFFKNRIYVCKTTVHALYMWTKLVLDMDNGVGGLLFSVNFSNVLSRLINLFSKVETKTIWERYTHETLAHVEPN